MVLRDLRSLAAECALQNLVGSQLQIAALLIHRWNIAPNIVVLEWNVEQQLSNFVLYALYGTDKDDVQIDYMLMFNTAESLMRFLIITARWNTKWFLYDSLKEEPLRIEYRERFKKMNSRMPALQRCSICDRAITSLIFHLEAAHSDRFTSAPNWMRE
ncbi:hypothetical protein Tcan_12189 [Toxocara canis]|uniref:Uncharacterized protein n=1 Tax=Toxocara canis TaxID=6265 RepID=A0A0B2UTV7_TOXCA|nr:hypothetical protein Tcan_12189 [Toxocara canis]